MGFIAASLALAHIASGATELLQAHALARAVVALAIARARAVVRATFDTTVFAGVRLLASASAVDALAMGTAVIRALLGATVSTSPAFLANT